MERMTRKHGNYDELAKKFAYLGIKNKRLLWHVFYGYAGLHKGHTGYIFCQALDDETLEFICGCGRIKLIKYKNANK